jgi:hypothetical protein
MTNALSLNTTMTIPAQPAMTLALIVSSLCRRNSRKSANAANRSGSVAPTNLMAEKEPMPVQPVQKRPPLAVPAL